MRPLSKGEILSGIKDPTLEDPGAMGEGFDDDLTAFGDVLHSIVRLIAHVEEPNCILVLSKGIPYMAKARSIHVNEVHMVNMLRTIAMNRFGKGNYVIDTCRFDATASEWEIVKLQLEEIDWIYQIVPYSCLGEKLTNTTEFMAVFSAARQCRAAACYLVGNIWAA